MFTGLLLPMMRCSCSVARTVHTGRTPCQWPDRTSQQALPSPMQALEARSCILAFRNHGFAFADFALQAGLDVGDEPGDERCHEPEESAHQ